MFILNKKSGMITECNNADVIKTCKKDANYEVKENREDFEAQEPQKEPEKVTPKETITEEKKTSPEEAEKQKRNPKRMNSLKVMKRSNSEQRQLRISG